MKTENKTHKVIGKSDDHGTFNVFVGTEEQCKIRLDKENEMNLEFEFSIIPLSKKLHTHKVIDTFSEASYFSGSEYDCYEFIDEEKISGDAKVVLLNDEEKLFFERLSKKSIIKTENKTHKVIDETLHEDEGQDCIVGTLQECNDFISEQNTIGLNVVPLIGIELQFHNRVPIKEKSDKVKSEEKFDCFKHELLAILHCFEDNILFDYSIIDIIIIKIPEYSSPFYLEHEKIVKIKKLLNDYFIQSSTNIIENMIVINSKLN